MKFCLIILSTLLATVSNAEFNTIAQKVIPASVKAIVKADTAIISNPLSDKIETDTLSITHYCLPLKEIHITSPFGKRIHPILKTIKQHDGIDLKAVYDPVYAVMNATVETTGYDDLSGNYIVLRHTESISPS